MSSSTIYVILLTVLLLNYATGLKCHQGSRYKTVIEDGFDYCFKGRNLRTYKESYGGAKGSFDMSQGSCLLAYSDENTDESINCYCDLDLCNVP